MIFKTLNDGFVQTKEKLATELGLRQPVTRGMPLDALQRHMLVEGQSGTGKTRFLYYLVLSLTKLYKGWGWIDVHTDPFRDLLYYLAALDLRYPRLRIAQRLVIVDPDDPEWVVTFNPLKAIEGLPIERVAAYFSDIVRRLWNVDPTTSPRMVHLMSNSFFTLSDLGLTLMDMPRLLTDAQWRGNLLQKLSNQKVANFWRYQFPKDKRERQIWIAPLMNKIEPLIYDPEVSLSFLDNPKLTERMIMDRQLILLVHASKAKLGEDASKLFAGMWVSRMQKGALSRADSRERPYWYLFLDEFQNFVTPHITDVLSESRKYGLGLTLSHQFNEQVTDPVLRAAVLNTTSTVISFRVGYDNAQELAREIFPSPHFLELHPEPQFRESIRAESWEGLTLELANLPDRVFWMKRRGPYNPVRMITRNMPDPIVTLEIEAHVRRLRAISGQQFGRKKADLRQEPNTIKLKPAKKSTQPSQKTPKKPGQQSGKVENNGQAGDRSATPEDYTEFEDLRH